jgi:transposase
MNTILSLNAQRAQRSSVHETGGTPLARNLLKVWPALWTFATIKNVTPNNNHAERGLRSAVIYRKLSLGSQSSDGETRIARLLSTHTTCRLQHRSLFEYLANALDHHARGAPVPLLA